MEKLIQIILASLIVSLISFSGAILFILKKKKIQDYLFYFVAFSAGSFLGGAFFHLIPESFNSFFNLGKDIQILAYSILFGILFFYIIEKLIHWHHHHDINCKHHPLTTLSLVGDSFHNFIDGIVIASSFLVDFRLGLITTLLIIFHEIPQEISDLAILLHGGYSRFKALFFNFISALFSVFGAVLAYFFLIYFNNIIPLMLSFTAGGFIYVALADIIPELHKKKTNILSINLTFILGIFISFLLTLIN